MSLNFSIHEDEGGTKGINSVLSVTVSYVQGVSISVRVCLCVCACRVEGFIEVAPTIVFHLRYFETEVNTTRDYDVRLVTAEF